MQRHLSIHPIADLPTVRAGDDLAALIGDALLRANFRLQDGDVVVVAQKIVSKSEGRVVRLDDVDPSPAAVQLAAETDKDPRLVELILRESSGLVRKKPGVIIVRHHYNVSVLEP